MIWKDFSETRRRIRTPVRPAVLCMLSLRNSLRASSWRVSERSFQCRAWRTTTRISPEVPVSASEIFSDSILRSSSERIRFDISVYQLPLAPPPPKLPPPPLKPPPPPPNPPPPKPPPPNPPPNPPNQGPIVRYPPEP